MAEEILQITTIQDYFTRIYGEGGISQLYKDIHAKLFIYMGKEYPNEVCINSIFADGNLLGTLTFFELDVDNYPIYTGNIDYTDSSFIVTTYTTEMYHSIFKDESIWEIRLSSELSLDTIIRSLPSTSLDPTLANFEGISSPTSGACKIPKVAP